MEVRGRVFLVTGGGSGLGAATARMLAEAGASVVTADLRGEPEEGIWFVETDVTDEESMKAAVAVAPEVFGGLHGLVNCAGVAIAERVLGRKGPHPLESFAKTVQVNLIGAFNAVRLAAEAMTENEPGEDGERGVIVNTASVAAYDGQIGQSAYAASKGGVAAMTLPLSRELARHGIRVVTIAPGIFDTPMMAGLPEEARDSLGKQVPFPSRLGKPEEYADLVRHIVENRMLNGEVIRLDGAIRMSPARSVEIPSEANLGSRLRLLRAAAFLSTVDRFTIAPMLVTIAADLDVSLAEVAIAASVYYLLYGLMQPVWGALSDGIGRVNVIRLTLVAALLPGLLSALAPNLAALIVGRALAGGLFAAVIPASLVYIGDTVPIATRQKALADQLATSAVATAFATVAAGAAAYLDLWRLAFAAPVLASAILGLLLARRLPEPEREDGDTGLFARLGTVVGKPWAMLVVLLALIEGGVILGFLTYLAPALEDQGYSAAAAGLVVGLYGVATLAWTQLLKKISDRAGRPALIILGGVLLTVGYAAGAVGQNLVGVSLAAVFVGGGFAFMHSTLQTWATEVAPEARAVLISLFAAALFTGSGLATSAAAPLAGDGSFGLLFALAAIIALPLGLFGGLARRRYDRK